MGLPRMGKYCLGMEAPIRLPVPPESKTTLTDAGANASSACS